MEQIEAKERERAEKEQVYKEESYEEIKLSDDKQAQVDTRKKELEAMRLVSASVCPSTRMSIICIAKTSSGAFHSPCSQKPRTSVTLAIPVTSELVNVNAKTSAMMVRITAMVNGAGNNVLKVFSIADEKLIQPN